MNIEDCIATELERFRVANPCMKYLDQLYLGTQEYKLLWKTAKRFNPRIDKTVRLQHKGMWVYKVDCNSFLCFGVSQPSPCG